MDSRGWVHQNGSSVSAFTWDPPHPGNCITFHDGFFIHLRFGQLIEGYQLISFENFCILADVKVPEKPKEVIINWSGSFVDIKATVRKSHIQFEASKNIVNLVINNTQLTEVLTALKSLEDE